MADLESVILADDIGEGARVVVTALDDLMARFGAEATVEFYRRTCPNLFDRGAIAYWVGSRELVGATVAEGVTRVAQCVFELRDGRLRVLKAEGRSSWLQGAMVDLDLTGEVPVASREHAVGRLGEGLKRVRAERNLTQAQMAELAHVTPAAVSQAETGRRGLSLDTLVPLVEALGVGLDDLLGTGRRRGPFIARPDRRPTRSGSALFDDPVTGPLVHLVELEGEESRGVPVPTHGTELVLCAEGLVMVDLGETTPVLRAHDALMVTEESVLSFTNLASAPASVFWVAL
ncbi:MAG: helix-turn-helix transcriptional regulator [Microthrixaceae bacterium]|nr:helix-turn-helix transcriptional regulator [Microthrixaceae bacterium]